MASPTMEYLRSPFENVLQILPQGHDKALKQAFYNTAATLFVVIVCCAAVAVYYILEVFLRPLLWALLCGTFLHPFKNTLTTVVQGWLKTLGDSGTPLVAGVVLLPLRVVDKTTETLASLLFRQMKLILGGCTMLGLVYLLYYFGPLSQILAVMKSVFFFIYDALGYFNALWVWTFVLAYTAVVIFYWTPQSSQFLRHLSIPVWVSLVFHLASIAGPLRVPIVMALLLLMIVGFFAEMKQARKKRKASSVESSVEDTSGEVTGKPESTETTKEEEKKSDSTDGMAFRSTFRPRTLHMSESTSKSTTGDSTDASSLGKERKLSDTCFLAIFWTILLVKLWMNFWILQLLPVFACVMLIKRIGAQLGSWEFLREKVASFSKHMTETIGNDSRFDILAPKPIRGLFKLILRGDRKVIAALEKSMDKTVSILIILLLLIGMVLITFFMAVQVHRESMHLVSVTSNVLNNSLHPELSQWMPDNEDMQKALDSMVGNAYLYGREWLTNKINNIFGDTDSKSHMEKQVLDVWDKLYETYFLRNVTAPQAIITAPDISTTNWTNVWEMTKKVDFNLNIMAFVNENIGVFMQVVESVWLVLKGNINLALNVATAALSILLGGGSAILNFVLAAVVFITTLFYLLASSGDQYKPMEWFMSLSPAQGGSSNKFGQAVEEAIGSVFMASFKMAAFYGLYTWLTHTVFGINIVYIPASLAAIFAAIPFLGTYWAAIPAIVELWLVNGDSVRAILLFVIHLLPTYFVDTAIYSDIKGGHPYLTGLAITGGIFWLGLEGAIIGPILLCCLIVAMNVYSTMMKTESNLASTPATAPQESEVEDIEHAKGTEGPV